MYAAGRTRASVHDEVLPLLLARGGDLQRRNIKVYAGRGAGSVLLAYIQKTSQGRHGH